MESVFKHQGLEGDINVSVRMATQATIVKPTGMSAGMDHVSMEEPALMVLLTTTVPVQRASLGTDAKSMWMNASQTHARIMELVRYQRVKG